MAEKPRRLDARFELLAPIGSGSMGTVYRGFDHEADEHVAIKLLHAVETADRFEREARVLSQIAHPNIVRYVAHGMTATGEAWLAMEWLDGVDLSAHLKNNGQPLTPRETILVGRAIALGLSWAHERGFVHRDMKPSNVFVAHGELALAKIVDFGLARDVAHDEVLTKTGALIGTLDYMPPEQLMDAKRVNARADVFSLGAVMFRCLTGRAPVIGKSLPELVMNIVKNPIPMVTDFRSDVPPALTNLLAWMLQKDETLRPANATAVVPALDALEGELALGPDLDDRTELTRSSDILMAEANGWQGLDDTATVRMGHPVLPRPLPVPQPAPAAHRPVSVTALRSVSGTPATNPSQGTNQPAVRQDGLSEWLPVILLAIVTVALLAMAFCR
jgi:eukaryotic-like serine/threonine-protein kinase